MYTNNNEYVTTHAGWWWKQVPFYPYFWKTCLLFFLRIFMLKGLWKVMLCV